MSFDFIQRTENLIGTDAAEKLNSAKVAVFGLGGVGSYIAEALARAGVGELHLIDGDEVALSNINRQLFALRSTLGKKKTEAAKERLLDINPHLKIYEYPIFYSKENQEQVPFEGLDYVADAIDTVTSKLLIAEKAFSTGIPVIASMGTGNKLDPMKFEITDISKTSVCPLARVMRLECKKRGIKKLTVLYSKEIPQKATAPESDGKKNPPASISFVPSAAGLMIAGKIIRDIIEK